MRIGSKGQVPSPNDTPPSKKKEGKGTLVVSNTNATNANASESKAIKPIKSEYGYLVAKTQEHARLTQEHARLTQEHARLTQEHARLTQEHAKLTAERSKNQEGIAQAQKKIAHGQGLQASAAERREKVSQATEQLTTAVKQMLKTMTADQIAVDPRVNDMKNSQTLIDLAYKLEKEKNKNQ